MTIDFRKYVMKPESPEILDYLFNKYLKPKTQYFCHCKIGNSIWCYRKLTPEERASLERIAYKDLWYPYNK